MSSTINQTARKQSDWGRRARRAIVVNAHPGGRFPGVELPPTWYPQTADAVTVPSVLPVPGDLVAIYDAVVAMGIGVRDAALEAYALGKHPMLIGGDHSLIIGTLAAATRVHPRVGVIWVDAHADFNVPATSPTGNPHGMPLAVSCGIGDERLLSLFDGHVEPRDVVLIGARDIDPGESELLRAHGIWHITVDEARRMGPVELARRAAEHLAGCAVHLSFDFDALTGEIFSATGTPVPDGFSADEGSELLSALAANGLDYVSSDWVEFDPRHPEAPQCGAIARRMFRAFHGGDS
jgi:arginase